jgi:hypothetical protein
MLRPLHYTLDGHEAVPVPPHRWEMLPLEQRRVAEDTVSGFWVSTVFLGIDHGWDGEPLLFETGVFAVDPDGERAMDEVEEMSRYATWTEAEVGHLLIVQALRTDQRP